MKLATVSDIHGMWSVIQYPAADVLIFAGDILRNYFRNSQTDAHAQLLEVEKFRVHCETLLDFGTYKHILFCPGNHDWCFQLLPHESKEKLGDKIKLLIDAECVIDGVKFYSSPHQPFFWNWAFNFPDPAKDAQAAKRAAQLCWAAIPDDVNVLITHGPPKEILDQTMHGENVGCPYLRERIDTLINKNLKLHVFGHIHHSYGKTMKNKTLFVNTSICTEKYTPDNPVPVLNI